MYFGKGGAWVERLRRRIPRIEGLETLLIQVPLPCFPAIRLKKILTSQFPAKLKEYESFCLETCIIRSPYSCSNGLCSIRNASPDYTRLRSSAISNTDQNLFGREWARTF
jgi:hypothetical protein